VDSKHQNWIPKIEIQVIKYSPYLWMFHRNSYHWIV